MSTSLVIGAETTTAPNQRAIGDVIAMQLASITYCSLTHNVRSTLHAVLPGWQLVWEPVKVIGGNYAFIAYNGVQYVIAIRGSILEFSWAAFDNWFEQDFNIFLQEKWIYTQNPAADPKISRGAWDGLQDLMVLTDKNGDTMESFILKNAIPNGKFIGITGHSLGGNLATVYAMYLRYQILQSGGTLPAIYSVLTFAAPTSWNIAFADEFDASLTNTWRYYGMLDIVPFSACDVIGLGNLYPPPAPSASSIYVTYKGKNYTLAEAFDVIQGLIAASELINQSVYGPVNNKRGTVQLNTNLKEYKMTYTDLLARWFEQAGEQHDHNRYLEWMGASAVNCTN